MESRIFVCLSKTVFAKQRLQSLFTSDLNCLLVCPSNERFNDFGTVSHVDVFAIQSDGISAALPGKLLIADHLTETVELKTSDLLRKILAGTPDAVLPIHQALKSYRFLSALIDSHEYEKLIDLVGRNDAEELLQEANDVGLLLSKQPENQDLIWFQTRPEYGQSLLRSDATFLAVFDLPNQLSARRPPIERPTKIKFATNLIGKGKIEFSFMEDALGASNVNVLVGVNGVGKSRLLRELACATETFGPILFLPSPLDDVGALPSEIAARVRNHPATAAGWETISKTVALITRDRDGTQYRTLRRAISGFLALDEIALPLIEDDRSIEFTTHTVRDRRYAQLRGIFTAPEGRKTALFGLVDYRNAPVFVSEGNPRHLSSGERALFGLAATLIRDIPERGLVLLDEPELSLHPRMIADLMRLLGLLLRARRAHCIIATHSLFIVRETPDAAVHVLKRSDIEEGSIVDYEPMIQTLGAGLTELSNVIFDDWNIKEYFQQRIEEYLEKPRSDEELSRTRNQLGETARAIMLDLTRDHNV
ncbi:MULTISPECIES: AAA family ATPase [Delftia]|uniref:AAA family ATPase n=1 Tax=Delftia TaxID=80865 RepID=UPI001E296A4F|nr:MULTISPECIES: AAA family ATPase [Delftia]MCB4786699.1 ATP-binding protein [Delftia sp. Lp-1]